MGRQLLRRGAHAAHRRRDLQPAGLGHQLGEREHDDGRGLDDLCRRAGPLERRVRARDGQAERAGHPDGGSGGFRGLHGEFACWDDEEGYSRRAD